MPDANVNITGSAGSAVAAVKAAQAAIDSLHGKTVSIGVEGGGGSAAAGKELSKLGGQADDISRRGVTLGVNDKDLSRSRAGLQAYRDDARDAARDVGRSFSRASGERISSAGREQNAVEGTESTYKRLAAANDDYRKGLVGAEGDLGGFGKTAGRIGNSLGGVGSDVDKIMSAVTSAGPSMGSALTGVAYGAGLATVAMGALDLGVAGIGAGGAMEMMKQVPAIATAGRDAMRQFTDGVHDSAGAALRTSGPAFTALKGTLGGLGEEFGKVSAASLAPTLGVASQLAAQATTTLGQLAPSIVPAERAFGALGGAVLRGLGASGPYIDQFTGALAAAAPAAEGATTEVVRGLSMIGSEAVTMFAKAEPALHGVNNALGGGLDLLNGAMGIPSANTTPPSPDGKIAGPSTLNRIGSAASEAWNDATKAAGLGPFAMLGAAGYGAYKGYNDVKMPNAGLSQGTMYDGSSTPLFPMNPAAPHWDANKGESAPSPQPGGTPFYGPQGAGQPSTLATSGVLPKPAGMPGGDKPLPDIQRHVGSSAGLPGGAGAAALNQQLAQTRSGLDQTTAAAARLPGQMNNSFAQSGQAAQQLPQHVNQAAAQMPAAVAQHAAQIPQAMAQPLQQMPRAAANAMPPAAMAAPVHSMVTHAVAAAQPAADSGGADLGGSVTGGMGKAITTTVTDVVTEVHKLMKKVIEAGAEGLDSHSPSREFQSLGLTVGQGAAVGIEQSAPMAVAAASNLMSNLVSTGGSAVGSGGVGAQLTSNLGPQLTSSMGGLAPQLSSSLGGQLTSALSSQDLGALGAGHGQQLTDGVLSGLAGLPGGMKTAAEAGINHFSAPGAVNNHLMSDGNAQITGNPYSSGGGGGLQTDAQKQQDADWLANRKNQLAKLGYNDSTVNRLLGNEQTQRGAYSAMRRDRAMDHDSALYRASHPGQPYSADPSKNAAAWRSEHPNQGWSKQYADADAQAQKEQKASRDTTARTAPGTGGWRGAASGMVDAGAAGASQIFHNGYGGAQSQGKPVGADFGLGVQKGIDGSTPGVQSSAQAQAQAAAQRQKDVLGIASPSKVTTQIGSDFGAGLSGGITSATGAITGIANNRGLQVGYVYGQGILSGVNSVIKQSDFQSNAIPEIGSDLAKTALGQLGLLGSAGSGASIWKNPMVTMGGAQPAPTVTVINYLDGTQLDSRTHTILEGYTQDLNTMISAASG